jgi:hypothetical protein
LGSRGVAEWRQTTSRGIGARQATLQIDEPLELAAKYVSVVDMAMDHSKGSLPSLKGFARFLLDLPRAHRRFTENFGGIVSESTLRTCILFVAGMCEFVLNADSSLLVSNSSKPDVKKPMTWLATVFSPVILAILFSMLVVLCDWCLSQAEVFSTTILPGFANPPKPLYPFAMHALKQALALFWANLLIFEVLLLYIWLFTQTSSSFQNSASGSWGMAAVLGAMLLLSVSTLS